MRRLLIISALIAMLVIVLQQVDGQEPTEREQYKVGTIAQVRIDRSAWDLVAWQVEPTPPDGAMLTVEGGNTLLLTSSNDAQYFVVMHGVKDGQPGGEARIITFSGNPNPNPQPQPNPDPDPTPDPTPPPSQATSVLILEESGESTQEQRASTQEQRATILALSAYLDNANLTYRVIDQDVKDSETGETPRELQPALDAASSAGVDLPVLIFCGEKWTPIDVVAMPNSEVNAINLVEGMLK